MVHQSELALEDELIKQLEGLDYEFVNIHNIYDLNINLRNQLEKLNGTKFSDIEFNRILTHLEDGSIYAKAERLRDYMELERDDGIKSYIKFFDKRWCKNSFQVAHQITIKNTHENRYDVTVLINGLPLVQIELKRRGIELKQAFNQTQRYQKQTYSGLFNYIQVFIISNGVDTKYYANNKNLNYKFTFFWKDENNENVTNLKEFTDVFLDRFHIHRMISKYIVLSRSTETLTILRSYQFYAVEAILEKALHSKKNGYVWHTTGSGKTLTSFKASQLLADEKDIDKVLFVVDRRDLDNQTLEEFNKFGNDCVDETYNTNRLVRQLTGTDKLIVTTIQKLSSAVKNNANKLMKIKDNKMVLMFDECHSSQFGEMHSNIVNFFTNIQYFGFTGTPILNENAVSKTRTTHDIFGECLHKYLIVDAIADENVLGFSVEYFGGVKNRLEKDVEVEAIDTKEAEESEKRIEKIVDHIIEIHNKKTYDKEFTSILAVSSVKVLQKYYQIFKNKEHDLKIATIYSVEANPDVEEDEVAPQEYLEGQIHDYNQMFNTNFSTDNFQMYYQDVSRKSKNKQIDILLVVNMFLTGFDNKYLNTLYVDKNLEYHGLLQAYSRTNRLCNEKKTYGNIVCYRNLKKQTDDAIKLFSNENALESILIKPYDDYVKSFNKEYEKLDKLVENINDLNDLKDIEKQAEFVKIFRNMLRDMNKLKTFTEFNFNDLNMPEQDFEDYKSKYLDLHEKTENPIEKESILNDIDFEIELLHKDDINVAYILNLLKQLNPQDETFPQDRDYILDVMEKDKDLRSKIDLVDKFIKENMIETNDDTEEKFENFIDVEKEKAINDLVEEEDLKKEKIDDLINEYEFSGKMKQDNIKESFNQKLKFKEKRSKTKLIAEKIRILIDKYSW